MEGLKDYKIIYEGKALPKIIKHPIIEIYEEDFSIFGIEKYTEPRLAIAKKELEEYTGRQLDKEV